MPSVEEASSPNPRPATGASTSSLIGGASIIGAGILSSRILGLAREMVIARTFDKSVTDLFFVAFTIPNALRQVVGEGAVSGAFVPVFTEVENRDGKGASASFAADLYGTMLVLLLALSTAGVLAAPLLMWAYGDGYEGWRRDLGLTLTRLIFPYIFFAGLGAVAMGALNARRRFAAPAFAPAMLNVAVIGAALLLPPTMHELGLPPVAALCIGALFGGLLQLAFVVPALRRERLPLLPRFRRSPAVAKCFRLMVPLLAGMGVYQLNIILSRRFASELEAGSQSYLYYAQRLTDVPLAVFSIAIASAALPALSSLRESGKHNEVTDTFLRSARLSLFVALPSAAVLLVLAQPIIAIFLEGGPFGALETRKTAAALMPYAFAIAAVAVLRVVLPVFHAYNDTKTPVVASAANLATFVVGSRILMPTLEHVGIAVAAAVASFVQLLLLLWLLRRKLPHLRLAPLLPFLLRAILVLLPTVSILWLGRYGANALNAPTIEVAVVAGTCICAAATYLLLARVLGLEESAHVLGIISRMRLKK